MTRILGRFVALVAVIYVGAHLAVAQRDPMVGAIVALATIATAFVVDVVLERSEP